MKNKYETPILELKAINFADVLTLSFQQDEEEGNGAQIQFPIK